MIKCLRWTFLMVFVSTNLVLSFGHFDLHLGNITMINLLLFQVLVLMVNILNWIQHFSEESYLRFSRWDAWFALNARTVYKNVFGFCIFWTSIFIFGLDPLFIEITKPICKFFTIGWLNINVDDAPALTVFIIWIIVSFLIQRFFRWRRAVKQRKTPKKPNGGNL